MKRRTWYHHHFKQFIHRRIQQLRDDGLSTALRDGARQSWIGALSAVGPLTSNGVPIWDLEWDVLVVLDACRVDAIREIAECDEFDFLPGADEVDTVESVGSCTPEWMDTTFSPQHQSKCKRTAYVAGNPHTASDHGAYENLPLDSSNFGLLDEVWKTEWELEGTPTVPPDPLTEHTVDIWRAREELDVDQIIVHYLQPHKPYRSLSYQDSLHPAEATVGAASTNPNSKPGLWEKDHWAAYERGDMDYETIWAAYIDNLRWVLTDLSRLVKNVDGRITITADHGEAFGEWGIYKHPPRSPLRVLRQVPLITLNGVDQKTLIPDITLATREEVSDPTHRHRLRSLGYLDE